MKLTKKYQIVYSGKAMLFPLQEMPDGGVTYVGNGMQYAEFDSLEEAESFVTEKELVYTQF